MSHCQQGSEKHSALTWDLSSAVGTGENWKINKRT